MTNTDPTNTTFTTEPGTTISQPGEMPFAKSPSSRFFVLSANITFPASARESGLRAGFQILSSDSERTNIWYQLSSDTFSIDRFQSSAAALSTGKFDLRGEKLQFRLFDIERSGNVETLRLTVVVDNSIVKVFVNERFALASQIKPWYANSTNISFLHDGERNVTFSDVIIHEGLVDAFPTRE